MSKNRLFSALLLTALVSGCGGSNQEFVVTNTAPPLTDRALIEQAQAQDPETALDLIPTDHLDPLTPPPPASQNVTLLPVADLESNYETLFGSLSQDLNVNLQTPEVVSNIDFIKGQQATGNFDLLAKPILNNPLGITSVSFQPVNYSTTVPLPGGDRTFQVSGGLLLPTGVDKAELKGVIVYFHGTTFSKDQVGSSVTNPETQLCAQVFASQGYAVVIPDYVGQGVDWQNVHPYVLYPKASAQAAADMLTAIKPILADTFTLNPADPALKLFSAGYSEGGAYSLWFNSYLSSNPDKLDSLYQLTHSVGMEGAYSTSEVTFDYLFQEVGPANGNPFGIQSLTLVNMVKPILSADAFLSYATYSEQSNFENVFNMNFFNMAATPPVPQSACNVDGQQVTIASAFARPSTEISNPLVFAALGKTANRARYPGPLQLLTSTSNSVNSLVSSAILDPQEMAELQEVMKAADVDLTPCVDGTVSIITLDQDSVVVPNNFDLLSSRFPGKFREQIKVDHTQLQATSPFSSIVGRPFWIPIDHLQAPVFEFLYALNIFNELQ